METPGRSAKGRQATSTSSKNIRATGRAISSEFVQVLEISELEQLGLDELVRGVPAVGPPP